MVRDVLACTCDVEPKTVGQGHLAGRFVELKGKKKCTCVMETEHGIPFSFATVLYAMRT